MRIVFPEIRVINRQTGLEELEHVYGEQAVALLYDDGLWGKLVGFPLRLAITRSSLFSRFYGWLQRRSYSRKKIPAFVKRFDIDASEFAKPTSAFTSFDDFFTRKLRPECRPIAPGDHVAIMPADGRYWVCPNVAHTDSFLIKGRRYALTELLDNAPLAARYAQGSLVMARLCPTDYHRFHFPTAGVPSAHRLIRGAYGSVNPVAIRRWFKTFTENKRMVSTIQTDHFGLVTCVEIGATAVGTIHQTYSPGKPVARGEEKGYFSFGGSSLVLLFEPGTILLADDLIRYSRDYQETLCRVGQPLGIANH